MLQDIVRLQLDRIVKRVRENHGIRFVYDRSVVDLIVSRRSEVASGGGWEGYHPDRSTSP